ncbi:hypothetical protein F5Y15DRAFT_107682 [Xylariaceae sp. FL0016]|nr:hypothetical protein F5Y15DRAFT_107682 [Xylariaceae sp. FL0016]
MPPSDGSGNNPFVSFKNRIDDSVSRGVQAIVGQSHPSNTQPEPEKSSQAMVTSLPTSSMDISPQNREPQGSSPDITEISDIYSWVATSSYSPFNLQWIRQPVPRNLPAHQQHLFTFREAFEDLLLASAGEPLPSLEGRAVLKELEGFLSIATGGLQPDYWTWSLGICGLWGSYFNLSPVADRSWALNPPFRGTGSPFDMSLAGHWLRSQGQTSSWLLQDDTELASIRKRVMKAFDDVRKEELAHQRWDGLRAENVRESSSGLPETEEELYHALDSHATPTRALVQGPRQDCELLPTYKPQPPLSSETYSQKTADGGMILTTVWRDSKEGKDKVKTETRHFDAEGQLISHEEKTETRRTWSAKGPSAEASFSWTSSRTSNENSRDRSSHNNAQGMEGQERKQPGWSSWLWTR